jgi:hypothetical protein
VAETLGIASVAPPADGKLEATEPATLVTDSDAAASAKPGAAPFTIAKPLAKKAGARDSVPPGS